MEIAPRLTVPVACAGHLVATKILAEASDRPQDAADLRALVHDLPPVERRRAIEALQQMAEIGAHRGKSLNAEARRWLGDRLRD